MPSAPSLTSPASLTSGHTAAILDGKKVAEAWQQELAVQVSAVHNKLGRAPGLGVVLVGNRPDSRLYVLRKQEACVKVTTMCPLPSTTFLTGRLQL